MYRSLAIVILIVSHVLGMDLGNAEEVKALRMIVVRQEQEARKIHEQLQQGASFSALAGTKSIGPARRSWGYSGIVRLDDVEPDLRAVLRKLRSGQISDVLELRQHFVIIKAIAPEIEQHYEAANRAASAGQMAQAVQELQAALRLEKDNIQTHIKLGMLYENTKQYEQAIFHLETAQRYAPQVAQITMLRGTIYMHAALEEKNRAYAQKALQVYQEALQQNEQLAPAVHFGLGKIYLLVLQKPAAALVHLEKAVKISPDVPDVYRLLIQAHYDTKDYAKAWQYLRVAQNLGFEFPRLLAALHKVKQRVEP